MKMKKLLAATCAGTLALSLAVPAFATAQPFNNQSTNFTSEIAKDDIGTVSVVVPGSAKLYVNPYGALIQLNDDTQTFGTGDTALDLTLKQGSVSDTMFSQTRLVQNTGAQALDLKVVVKSADGTTKANKAKFIAMGGTFTTPTADTAPEMMGFFEIQDATVTDGTVSAITWTSFDDYAATDNTTATGMVPILDASASATATATDVCYTLAAATTENVDDGFGGTTTVSKPSYAAFHLVGQVDPAIDADLWGNTDTALPSVEVVFAFTPAPTTP